MTFHDDDTVETSDVFLDDDATDRVASGAMYSKGIPWCMVGVCVLSAVDHPAVLTQIGNLFGVVFMVNYSPQSKITSHGKFIASARGYSQGTQALLLIRIHVELSCQNLDI
ncbi:hypothetical protein PROFUN_07496 [Planoprotostelium fungivorum]|uniref:Uncharacterized protein n=1 Tax=Planoprotostelium fungivorum TaxID=1890364 RepID=A0A2P6NLP0_9EUKA|nr:hypothetical protein PROFUN_07496 [Planoprotostelium fungivorum]